MDVYAFDYSGLVLFLFSESARIPRLTLFSDNKKFPLSYGYSTGHASERNVYSDIEAVYDYVRSNRPEKRVRERVKRREHPPRSPHSLASSLVDRPHRLLHRHVRSDRLRVEAAAGALWFPFLL